MQKSTKTEARRPVGRPPKGDKAKRKFYSFQHTVSRRTLFNQARRIVQAQQGGEVSDSQVFDAALIALIVASGGNVLSGVGDDE